ncbi:hypothetical protein SDC9_93938 [bioreactor metagenome]|uniref:Uncharacterized protein n=1 Tax=bioreactor metagenome TaxID=1076179 RepID=A0A645A201_9ZZZZ
MPQLRRLAGNGRAGINHITAVAVAIWSLNQQSIGRIRRQHQRKNPEQNHQNADLPPRYHRLKHHEQPYRQQAETTRQPCRLDIRSGQHRRQHSQQERTQRQQTHESLVEIFIPPPFRHRNAPEKEQQINRDEKRQPLQHIPGARSDRLGMPQPSGRLQRTAVGRALRSVKKRCEIESEKPQHIGQHQQDEKDARQIDSRMAKRRPALFRPQHHRRHRRQQDHGIVFGHHRHETEKCGQQPVGNPLPVQCPVIKQRRRTPDRNRNHVIVEFQRPRRIILKRERHQRRRQRRQRRQKPPPQQPDAAYRQRHRNLVEHKQPDYAAGQLVHGASNPHRHKRVFVVTPLPVAAPFEIFQHIEIDARHRQNRHGKPENAPQGQHPRQHPATEFFIVGTIQLRDRKAATEFFIPTIKHEQIFEGDIS